MLCLLCIHCYTCVFPGVWCHFVLSVVIYLLLSRLYNSNRLFREPSYMFKCTGTSSNVYFCFVFISEVLSRPLYLLYIVICCYYLHYSIHHTLYLASALVKIVYRLLQNLLKTVTPSIKLVILNYMSFKISATFCRTLSCTIIEII